MSTAVVHKSGDARKNNLAEVSKAARVSQRRTRLAERIKEKAVAVMGAAAGQKICDEIKQGQLSLISVKRDLRKAEEKKKLEVAAAIVRPAIETCDLRVCSMQELLGQVRGLDAIITDPPYPKEYVGLFGELAKLAKKALKPNGVLAVMCGQSFLPQIMEDMCKHLEYRWLASYLMPGEARRDFPRRVNCQFKPILIFGGRKWITDDVVRSDVGDKLHHEWGQSESGIGRLTERLTEPNDLVCDPFLGGGTTAAVAIRLHRRVPSRAIDRELVG